MSHICLTCIQANSNFDIKLKQIISKLQHPTISEIAYLCILNTITNTFTVHWQFTSQLWGVLKEIQWNAMPKKWTEYNNVAAEKSISAILAVKKENKG